MKKDEEREKKQLEKERKKRALDIVVLPEQLFRTV